MRLKRVNRANRQQRAEAKAHIGRIPHFDTGEINHLRQAHAAMRLRPGHRIPAALNKCCISLNPAGGGFDALLCP